MSGVSLASESGHRIQPAGSARWHNSSQCSEDKQYQQITLPFKELPPERMALTALLRC
jgi:hypothetical protein